MTIEVISQRIWIALIHKILRNNLRVIYRHWLCELNRCVLSSKMRKVKSIICLKQLQASQMIELHHRHPLEERILRISTPRWWTSMPEWVQTLGNHLLVWESCWAMIHYKGRHLEVPASTLLARWRSLDLLEKIKTICN